MSVEIRELIIRAVVTSPGDRKDIAPTGAGGGPVANSQEIIAECVRQVLKIIKKSGER